MEMIHWIIDTILGIVGLSRETVPSFDELGPIIMEAIKTNEYLQATLGFGGLMTFVIGIVKGVPLMIYNKIMGFYYRFIYRRIKFEMLIEQASDEHLFKWFDKFISEIQPGEKRNFTLQFRNGKVTKMMKSDRFFFWHKRRPFWLVKSREKLETTSTKREAYNEKYRITTYLSKGSIEKLIKSLEQYIAEQRKAAEKEAWLKIDGRHVKTLKYEKDLSLIYFPEKDEMVKRIENFLKPETEAWYRKRGIPYKLVFMLNGLPGTGKTSFVRSCAKHFKINLNSIAVNPLTTSDGFNNEVEEIGTKEFLILDDMDRPFKKGKVRKEYFIDTGSYLSLLDGINTPHGVVIFCTSNHKDVLPPAMYRPGRVDEFISFGHAENRYISEYVSIFYDIEYEYKGNAKVGMSAIQKICIANMYDAAGAVKEIEALC